MLLIVGSVLFLAVAALGGWYFFLRSAPVRADVLLHTVKREPLVVTVAEKGTLESAGNRDIVCKVRAGSKGFASTINWVIDDGSRVKPGQLLMLLDSSALMDQRDAQRIAYETARANKVRAEKDYEIAVKQNQKDIASAESALTVANSLLKDYTGLTYDPTRAALAAVGGGMASLSEAGTYRQTVDDQTGQVKLAESILQQYRERSAWADRMVKLSYMSSAQAQAEQSKMDSAVEDLRSKRAKLTQLLASNRERDLTKLTLDRDIAQITLEQVVLSAEAKLVQFDTDLKKCILLYDQAMKTLRETNEQLDECKITAPADIEPDSMVVYFKNESNRFSSSGSQGLIEQGAQVKEGQKLLRIPNLRRMQVNTKVHEAMVARIRGDVRVPTHIAEDVLKLKFLNTDLFARAAGQMPESLDATREKLRDFEYKKVSEGQKASIRVDALGARQFEGHVRVKATVASQSDSWISDVKLYQTLVTIDHELLPNGTKKPIQGEELTPDMTAEVTIIVDTVKDPVLTVPVQSIIGGTEMGGKREVFVKTATGYERRAVELGLYNEKFVEIRTGLVEDDQVVTNPKVLLAPDDRTRTRDADTKNGGTKSGGEGKGDSGGYPKGDGSGSGTPGSKTGGGGKKKGAGGGPPGGGP